MHPACLFRKIEGGRTPDRVQCRLCAHYCLIDEGQTGRCGVRLNQGGELFSLVYGRPIAQHIDPIEKKPLFHFLPGSRSYSIACVGCNFICRHCQNADIAQMPRDRGTIMGEWADPAEVAAAAGSGGCASISYTYTEPTVFGEYVHDIAALARQEGLKNVIVSNGFLSAEARDWLAPLLDAANIDLKAFSEEFYSRVCGARLAPVLETLLGLKQAGVWLEVTTLLIPGLNDSPAELAALAAWIKDNLGPETPWHASRFHPAYRMTDKAPTGLDSLNRAGELGRAAGLKHIYLGNVPGRGGEATLCPDCGALALDRWGFTIRENRLKNGACPDCGRNLSGVWS